MAPAIQADVIDYDELYSGRRREAQYGGIWSVMQKFTVIPSMSIPLAVLASIGYEPNVEQSDGVKLAIRSIFALAPAVTGLLALAMAWFYPITEDVHRRILGAIEQHKRGEPGIDPLTGQAAWYDLRVRLEKVEPPLGSATQPRFDALKPPPGLERRPAELRYGQEWADQRKAGK